MNKIKKITFKDIDYSKYQKEIDDIQKQTKKLLKNPILRLKLFLFKKGK